MAKKKKNVTSAAATSGAPSASQRDTNAADRLDCERRFDTGDSAGARRSAHALLQAADATASDKERALAVLDMVKLDWQPLAVFAGLVVVLLVVFLNAIVARNTELKTLGPALDLTKSLIHTEPLEPRVPAQGPVEDNRGTP